MRNEYLIVLKENDPYFSRQLKLVAEKKAAEKDGAVKTVDADCWGRPIIVPSPFQPRVLSCVGVLSGHVHVSREFKNSCWEHCGCEDKEKNLNGQHVL